MLRLSGVAVIHCLSLSECVCKCLFGNLGMLEKCVHGFLSLCILTGCLTLYLCLSECLSLGISVLAYVSV